MIEISAAVAESIASWRRIFAGRNGADARDLLRKAAADLWETLEIDRTVHPEGHTVARQEVVDAPKAWPNSEGSDQMTRSRFLPPHLKTRAMGKAVHRVMVGMTRIGRYSMTDAANCQNFLSMFFRPLGRLGCCVHPTARA